MTFANSWSERPRRRPGLAAIDLLVVAVAIIAAFVGFGPVFGDASYLIAAGVGLVLGLALAVLGAWRRFGVLAMAALTIVAYLLFGGVAALRGTTIGGVIPTVETFTQLIVGVVQSWKGLLTVTPPAANFPELLVVPFLSVLVCSVFAASFALRLVRPACALLPIYLLFVATIVFGTQDAAFPVALGAFIALVTLAWLAWRRSTRVSSVEVGEHAEIVGETSPGNRQRNVRRASTAIALLAVGAIAAVGGTALAAPGTPRTVVRETIEPPLEVQDYASPLAGFRHYIKEAKDEVLFEAKGLPLGARLALGTLTAYDGIVYNVSGPGSGKGNTFHRVGSKLDATSTVVGTPAEVSVKVGAYSDVWLPTVGRPTNVSFSGDRSGDVASSLYFNPATSTALTTNGLVQGDEYRISTVLPEPMLGGYSDDKLTQRDAEQSPQLPDNTAVPEAIAAKAAELSTGAVGPWDLARRLQTSLSTTGAFCHGIDGTCVSASGHSSSRLTNFVAGERPLVGDDEQYAVAMALMARDLGLPARVVMGFYPDDDAVLSAGGWVKLTGNDLHVWVEIGYDEIGWVPYDPTPNEDQLPTEVSEIPNPDPEPQPLQPPPPPQAVVDPPQDVEQDRRDLDEDEQTASSYTRILAIAATVGIPLVLLGLPIALILGLKARRRRLRRSSGTGYSRATGGWDEVIDRAVDLGVTLPAGATRREVATMLDEKYPDAEVGSLARDTDAAVFGPFEPHETQVSALWNQVTAAVSAMKSSVGKWRRIWAGLSLRSSSATRRARRQMYGATKVATGDDARAAKPQLPGPPRAKDR